MIFVFQQAQNFGEQKLKATNQLFLALIIIIIIYFLLQQCKKIHTNNHEYQLSCSIA
jgi:hypothetical protein